jgi:hypothetical protein
MWTSTVLSLFAVIASHITETPGAAGERVQNDALDAAPSRVPMTVASPSVNRQRLTLLFVEGLKPQRGFNGRLMVYDTTVPALAVRVTEKGHKSFVLAARFPPNKNLVRRYIGDAVGPRAITLAEARRKAQAWLTICNHLSPQGAFRNKQNEGTRRAPARRKAYRGRVPRRRAPRNFRSSTAKANDPSAISARVLKSE